MEEGWGVGTGRLAGASVVVLTAINAHLRVGLVFVLALGAGLALSQLLGPALGWAGLLGPLLAAEGGMLLWVMARVLRVSGDAWLPFLAAAATEPWRRPPGVDPTTARRSCSRR